MKITSIFFKAVVIVSSFLTLLVSNELKSQSNCCNNDTIYFDNQVDCAICIKIECFDPVTGNSTVLNSMNARIKNNIPLSALPAVCPDPGCSNDYLEYIGCGGPTSPQLGKIIFTPHLCELCPALKISLTQLGSNIISPPLTVYTSNGPSFDNLLGSPCCHQFTPNLKMEFDCATKLITFKCD